MTCDTCQHWINDGLSDACDGVAIRACTHPMVVQPTYGKRNNRKMIPDGVLTMDEGGGTGELFTGPKFGCVHHKPTSKQNADCMTDEPPTEVLEKKLPLLLSCPFCGGRGMLSKIVFPSFPLGGEVESFNVRCDECHASTSREYGEDGAATPFKTPEEAAAAWNRRLPL